MGFSRPATRSSITPAKASSAASRAGTTGRLGLGLGRRGAGELGQGAQRGKLGRPDPTPWVQPNPNPVTGLRTVTNRRIGTTVENLGTIAARAGYAFDCSLVFVKGGAAWAYDVYRAFDAGSPGEPLIATGSDTRWGWMFGIGYKYAFLGNWSVKVEYDYLGFVSKHITLTSVASVTPPTRDFEIWQDISLVKVGINYRFADRRLCQILRSGTLVWLLTVISASRPCEDTTPS